jgi:hypothetical protein
VDGFIEGRDANSNWLALDAPQDLPGFLRNRRSFRGDTKTK